MQRLNGFDLIYLNKEEIWWQKLLELIVRQVPVCGLELVEVSPPYDISDMTSLMACRVICDTMAHLVVSGQLPRKQKPEWISDVCNMNVDQKWR